MNGDAIRMYGKGDSSRDYTFIDDIVQGIEAAMEYKDSGFEIINLGNSETVSLSELIAALEKHCGRKAIIEQWPEQPGDVPHTFADISKAKKLLNYQPKVSLEEGLEKFVEWLRV
jgi:UDP-glucuronate 4-epimerase